MATIAEKSRAKEIIEKLKDIIETATPVPFASGKVSIYKDEVQTLLMELGTQMENELKTYHEVNDRRGKILNEAKKEAEKIIFQAEHSASRMRVSKRATNVAPINFDMLDEEERQSLGSANEIYAASLIYTDEMLSEVTNLISEAYSSIRGDYEIMLQVLEEKLQIINNNKEELMSGLQEMGPEDHSQQILEIGQLLSNELFNERMKHKMASEQYEDGSIQLSLDFQKVQEEITKKAEEKAAQAEQEMLAMQAERDRLLAEIEQMKLEERRRRREEGAVKTQPFVKNEDEGKPETAEAVFEDEKEKPVKTAESETAESEEVAVNEDVEYEIVYVTEDELEEGEEYEIEYVDEDEYEELMAAEHDKADKDAPKEDVKVEKAEMKEEALDEKKPEEKKEETKVTLDMVDDDDDDGPIPIIPHFRTSQKITTAPSEQVAKMAKAVTTNAKYSGMIGGAVVERRKRTDDNAAKEASAKTEGNGRESKDYVEAKMEFAEDYDITEF